MKIASSIAQAALLLLTAGTAAYSQAPAGAETGVAEFKVTGVRLMGVEQDRLRLGVVPAIVGTRRATVRKIVFADFRINEIPVYVPPILKKLEIVPGQTDSLNEEVPVTVYFRDLDSLAPVEKILRDGTIQVRTRVIFEAHLNLLQQIVLMNRWALTQVSLKYDVPVDIPGGMGARAAALALLHAASPALESARSKVREWSGSEWRTAVAQEYRPNLFLVTSNYRLEWTSSRLPSCPPGAPCPGRSMDLAASAIGVRVGEHGEIVAPREIVEPWAFDPEILELIKSGKYRLVKDSVALRAYPAGARLHGEPAEFLPLDVVSVAGHDSKKVVMAATTGELRRLSVQQRDSDENMAILIPRTAGVPAIPARVASADAAKAAGWDRVVVFRLPEGMDADRFEPDVVVIQATRTGGRFALKDPIDSSAFGSPAIGPNGILGMVQDEKGGAILRDALISNRLDVGALTASTMEGESRRGGH